ncbi:hypothetical protein BOTCAL_0122g00160 [Botryotinia calthae]|uniref:Uncharacterized protein n=1 Tax=Botryotinia calthae TaxID=38488 RepID=A0A4Y8D4I7_9HELO|nr:hypothetical protein BOTCAL_0122g00160 [Botryotinia calthae]
MSTTSHEGLTAVAKASELALRDWQSLWSSIIFPRPQNLTQDTLVTNSKSIHLSVLEAGLSCIAVNLPSQGVMAIETHAMYDLESRGQVSVSDDVHVTKTLSQSSQRLMVYVQSGLNDSNGRVILRMYSN